MNKINSTKAQEKDFKLPFSVLGVIVSAAILLVSILYLMDTQSFRSTGSNQVGPDSFPMGIGIISIVLTSLLLLNSVIKLLKHHESYHVIFHRFVYILASISIIILVGGNLESLGAFFGPYIMATGIMFCCGERGLRLLIIPPCVGIAIYVIFVIALGVYFP